MGIYPEVRGIDANGHSWSETVGRVNDSVRQPARRGARAYARAWFQEQAPN